MRESRREGRSDRGGVGYSHIKMTGVLVVPLRVKAEGGGGYT